MHPNEAVIHRFYERFNAIDAEGMAACYQPDVVFSDPVFGELRGERAAAMWRMLAGRAKDLRVRVEDVRADDKRGAARWIADYSFGKTGRPVRNVIEARFEFRDGKIARHDDSFDLWRWSRMALGAPGAFLGWTPMMHARIRKDALRGLDAAMEKEGRARATV